MLNPGIKELQISRQKLLDGLAANRGFEDGLYESAKNLYAQQCHFIYELLQNAGDAKATMVEFLLTEDALEFRHNGEKRFDIDDVDSITNYHHSTKKDSDAVGKFGMGFKAVFHYTTTPEIHSGDFHFRIDRMFFPATDGVRTDEKLDGWTKFHFPFKHSERTTEEIFHEVKAGLKDIGSDTLLFLKQINQIECLFEDESYLKISKDEEDHLVRISRTDSLYGRTDTSYYLKFYRSLPAIVNGKRIEVALAYGLVPRRELEGSDPIEFLSTDRFKIAPIDGRVYIYFPAQLEVSHLKFHIHGSFASPITRESLSSCKGNEDLLKEVADLAVESLSFLRDKGFLTVDSLAVFPNPTDNLTPRYCPIRDELVKAFNSRNLTPTKAGSFKPASDLIRSENRLSDLFTDEDMAAIYENYRAPVWVKAPSMLHSREDAFLSSLDLETFGNSDLLTLARNDGKNSDNFVKLVCGFSDDKLVEVYKKIADASSRGLVTYKGCYRPIFRTVEGSHETPECLYFDAGVSSGGSLCFLKKIYKDTDSRLIAFLSECGVKTYSVENVIKDLVAKQTRLIQRGQLEGAALDEAVKLHLVIVRLLITAFCKNPMVQTQFVDFKWLCRTADGTELFNTADKVLLDSPYAQTGVSAIRHAFPSGCMLSERYAFLLSKPDLEVFKSLLGKYAFIRDLRERYIEQSGYISLWGHPCYLDLKLPDRCKQRDPRYWDCDIEGIKGLVGQKSDVISAKIWSLLMRLKDGSYFRNPFKAVCRHSGSCTRESDSLLVCHLRTLPWLKDKVGNWKKPEDVSFETLHEMYRPRDMCLALEKIGFGRKAAVVKREEIEKRRVQDEVVRELGATSKDEILEALDVMRAAAKEGIDVRALIAKRRMVAEMPESASGNAERRRDRVVDIYADAELQSRELRERSVKTSRSLAPEAREMLIGYYTDDHREMRCQLCRNPMPFSKRDGEAYFECFQLFRDMKKETKEHYLALCPTCAAMYDEWVRKHEKNSICLRDAIRSRQVSNGKGSVSLQLPDCGTPSCTKPPTSGMSLYFGAKHFIDLQTVLGQEEEV